MWSIINLVWFFFLAFLVLRVCYMLMKNQVVARKPKARVVYPYVAPKRPSAFDPANKSTLHLTEEDKRWFNHIARLCERPEPYPLSETGLPEAKMKAAGYTREIPEGEWVSVSMPFTGTWYRAVQENKFAKEFTDSLRDDSVSPTPN